MRTSSPVTWSWPSARAHGCIRVLAGAEFTPLGDHASIEFGQVRLEVLY
jgi:hypothetical protein